MIELFQVLPERDLPPKKSKWMSETTYVFRAREKTSDDNVSHWRKRNLSTENPHLEEGRMAKKFRKKKKQEVEPRNRRPSKKRAKKIRTKMNQKRERTTGFEPATFGTEVQHATIAPRPLYRNSC